MSRNDSGRKSPSTVGQPDKYDELSIDFLYSVPEEEMGGEPVGNTRIDGPPGTPSEEPLTDADGNEMVAGNYARERTAETDAHYRAMAKQYADDEAGDAATDADVEETAGGRATGTFADVSAVEDGQRLGDMVKGDVGELVRGVSTGAYEEQALAELDVTEDARDHVDPFAEVKPEHYALETEERLRGEYEANERARTQAIAAAELGIDRAERSREDMWTRRPIRTGDPEKDDAWDDPAAQTVGVETGVEPSADESATTEPVRNGPDPRASFGQDTLAKVNRGAARLAEHFQHETAMSRASFAKCIARRVQEGENALDATMHVREQLERISTIKQPIADINPWEQWETTVEATVDTLWDPLSPKQRQVGLVEDESGVKVKFTIWFKAGDKPTLAEGDRIRAERVRVNEYQGDVTLAVVGDSDITVLEDGDGPMRRRKRTSDEPRYAPWDVESKAGSWHNLRGKDLTAKDKREHRKRYAEATRQAMERQHPELQWKRQIRQAFGRMFSSAADQ